MKLIKIKLPLTANDKRVNGRGWYLAQIAGGWAAGKFQKEWYGWNFDGLFDAGYQWDYAGWEKLYRIVS